MRAHARSSITLLFVPSLALLGCDDNTSSTAQHATCPPPGTFQHAVCVCEDLEHVGALFAKDGPSGPGSVGINGRTDLVGYSESTGDWIAWEGFAAVGVTVGDSLITSKTLSSVGDVRIGGDAVIGGDLSCVGEVKIGGTLELGGKEHVVGLMDIAKRAAYSAPAGPPCNCDPSTFFDVEGAIAAAKQAATGASSWDQVGAKEIRLTGGNYYVTSADVIGKTTIYVDATSSVFVDGSLRQVGAEQWKLAPGATLDLFVGGDVASVGQLIVGNPADPAAFRLYIGGSGGTSVGAVGDTRFYGSVYAPRSRVAYVGNAVIVGAIFAKNIAGVGALTIEYGTPSSQPTSCDPPPGGSDGDAPVFL
ncbi:MAG TPA: hypothetical protein VIV11_33910 [Kofleriaceae bacterium]